MLALKFIMAGLNVVMALTLGNAMDGLKTEGGRVLVGSIVILLMLDVIMLFAI